jgi:UDP-glucuronate decarboxylase
MLLTFQYVWKAIRKQPMTVYGDGKQTRSFQYVSDLVWYLLVLYTLLKDDAY